MTKKILVTCVPLVRELLGAPGALRPAIDSMLEDGLEPVCFDLPGNRYSMEQFRERIPGVKAAIIGSEPWGEDKLALAEGVAALCRYGVGYDAVDIDNAKRRGILVTNTRVEELSRSVGEFALLLTLSALRRIVPAAAAMRDGKWKTLQGGQLRNKKIGIVGFGAIGRSYAECLRGFHPRLLVYDPYLDKAEAERLDAHSVGMDELLSCSDIVSLSAPNTPENKHLFNRETFQRMKRGAVFINTARGSMVDEAALFDALSSGRLGGAGLDVWEAEPTAPDNPLLTLDNVVACPHMSSDSVECAIAMAMCAVRQVKDALAGKRPDFVLNP